MASSGTDADGNFVRVVKKVKMGKRVERALKDKGGQSSSQEVNEDDANKTPDPYVCTGIFDADFVELCRRAGLPQSEIPPVVVRAKRPGTPPPPDTKKDDPKGKNQPPPEPTPDPRDESDPTPKTYVTKEKYQYFKPTIQVEMENDDKPATVTEIYIRGWKIDEMMVGIFKQCFPTIEKLSTINFWNCGLAENTVKELASFLPQCANLKNVTIEGNECKDEPWYYLISSEDSLIVNLSLRHNGITDKGAAHIGKALSTEKTCNKNLLTLSLCHNKITEEGATAIVHGLRMNRVLLSLSLANNRVGDQGAMKFGELLSRFGLTHTEVVERRKLISEKGSPDRGSGKSPPPSRRAESKDRPGSVRSGSHLDKGDKRRNKSSNKKDGKKDKEDTAKGTKKEDKWKKEPRHLSVHAETTKTAKGKKTTSSKDKKGSHEAETPDILEAVNPLTEPVESLNGELWIPGNRSLINLNLARNSIGEAGIKSLLLAVQYQTTLCALSPHPAMKGLLKLSLQGNVVSKSNEHYSKLIEMMVTKDPFYKPPELSPSLENQSTAG
ncbi:leucine-rich repeat-containing protein 71-like isoform X2 [Apostichopus japonicus]|uniref:leucine-rich repeat-containing protein 71-like isoform X2 n=1 Tax=Stichopus japonicus TaxID=307972 RepID=UPI003AB4A6C3